MVGMPTEAVTPEHPLTVRRREIRDKVIAAFQARGHEFGQLHHMYIRFDANAREKIADVVADALLADADCGCFHLPRHNPDCPLVEALCPPKQ